MPRLIIANIASAVPMGAEAYQEAVASRAAGALGDSWDVNPMVVRSLRSPIQGTHRLPMGWMTSGSPRLRRAVGRAVYPHGVVVHRMNLELPPSPYADVLTLHDVVAWTYADESDPVRAAAEEARRAAAVICVSAYTATQAVDLLGITDPYVVPNGVDGRFLDASPLTPVELGRLGIQGAYALASGGASARKNLVALAGAWPKVHSTRPDLTLVLSGPEHPERTRLFAGMPAVVLVGRIDTGLMPGLMSAASAVVVPSLHEGFGLPALEAMAVGTPVVAANTSSLPEVIGDTGILVEPSADELAEGMRYAVSGDPAVADAVRRARLRAAEFTWERSAAGHATVWRRVAAAVG